jgi:hypothetical protein
MAPEDAACERLDRRAIRHVADLDLAVDLGGQPLEQVLAPGDEDAAPAVRGQRPRGRLADAR